jgi:voltage-gated potassium channel
LRSLKEELVDLIIDDDTRQGRFFDLFIQSLIVLSLITFPLETIKNLSPSMIQVLNSIEIFTVSIFSIEYLLRIWLTKKSSHYIFSFFGIIDFLALLPFYLAASVDLRSIRVFRLLRLFRIFKLAKYSTAVVTFKKALNKVRSELLVFSFFIVILLYIASLGIYTFEHEAQPELFATVFDALWWSIVTLTTVGYGDAYPITVGGKIFTSIISLIGIGVVAVPTGLLATSIRDARMETIVKEDDENNSWW